MKTSRRQTKLVLSLATTLLAGAWVLPVHAQGTLGQATHYRRAAERLAAHTLSSAAIEGDACDRTTNIALRAGVRGALQGFDLALGACVNLTDPGDLAECFQAALDQLAEDLELVDAQLVGRENVCALLGGGPYAPDLDPASFVSGISNPLLPFSGGGGTNTWTYHKQTPEGLEVIFLRLTGQTKEILGIECVEVRDTVTIGGELIEDTFDWYAEDLSGNVWYMGELAMNYEDGALTDLDGSWVAGIEGALPGIVMLASPTLGTTYRQEWWLAEAEDLATVEDTNASVTIGFGGTYTGCLKTFDFTPIDPDALECKYYAPGVGVVLETNPDGERTELVAFP